MNKVAARAAFLPDRPAFVHLSLQHDQGISVAVLLPSDAAKSLARNIIEAADAVSAVNAGETPNFAPNFPSFAPRRSA